MAIPPTTVLQNLERDGETIKNDINALGNFAKIAPPVQSPTPNAFPLDPVRYTTLPPLWLPLELEGKLAQTRALKSFNHFRAITNALFVNIPKNISNEYQKAISRIDRVIQLHALADKEVFQRACDTVDKIIASLRMLATQQEFENIVVPDTNALIHNPAFEGWSFAGVKQFTIAITPTVTRELDGLKINHRNEDVKRKAETIIRKFKDYRRRGSLTEGVVLVTDRILLRAYAIEPDVTNALPWLDPNNDDDRHIATTIEIMRDHVGSSVSIVSHDINLLNKAEVARIPLLEPPEPKP